MGIIDLPPGEKAPEGSNQIVITATRHGKFEVAATVSCGSDGAVFLATGDEFSTVKKARHAAVEWARAQGADLVYVEGPDV